MRTGRVEWWRRGSGQAYWLPALPAVGAELLAARQICTWNRNTYAQELTEHLGIEAAGRLLRIGLVHYNTADEVDRALLALDEL